MLPIYLNSLKIRPMNFDLIQMLTLKGNVSIHVSMMEGLLSIIAEQKQNRLH